MNLDIRPHSVRQDEISRVAALQAIHVSKRFRIAGGSVQALADLSLSVDDGEFVAIVGASGCGKSTLLRLILGLDKEYEGEIRLDGRRVLGPGLDRGMVFQDHRLLPWLTVSDNVAVALRRSSLSAAEKREQVAEYLDLVGLTSFSRAWPSQLSGGMSQRVAIARALVNRPRFLLLDEPFGALDALTRLRLQDELARVVRRQGSTAVLVTHDVQEAAFLADRIVVLQSDPGRVAGTVDVGLGPERDRSAPGFVGLQHQVLAMLGVNPRRGAPAPRPR